MKRKRFIKKLRAVLHLSAVITVIVSIMLPGGAVWAINAVQPLSKVENPVLSDLPGTPGRVVVTGSGLTAANTLPPNMHIPVQLAPYIKDMNAAITLGKALFWDMQVGSDGATACATCHHRAGVDPIKHAEDADSIRDQNELNPGSDGKFDAVSPLTNATILANSKLSPGDFNFTAGICVSGGGGCTRVPAPAIPNAFTLIPGTTGFDDVVGSQGVVKIDMDTAQPNGGIVVGSRKDAGKAPLTPEATFVSGGVNVRQVTGRNTPPTINAVFNFDNFWDGRANHIFNGNNPIGAMDTGAAGIWRTAGILGLDATLVNEKVAIPNASLASQSVGPPLSSVEMSYNGRSFPQLGKKMLNLTPLGIQTVSPTDSVLGPLSNFASGGRGLNTTYTKMIQAAFVDSLWNSGQSTPAGYPRWRPISRSSGACPSCVTRPRSCPTRRRSTSSWVRRLPTRCLRWSASRVSSVGTRLPLPEMPMPVSANLRAIAIHAIPTPR